MDLIRNNEHIVGNADMAHPLKFFPCPHNTQGVVGAAQKEYLCFLCLFLKILKINNPASVLFLQRALNHFTAPALGHIVEFRVHRGLDQHLVPRLREHIDHGGQRGNHSQVKTDHALVNVPSVAALLPTAHSLIVRIRTGRITPDAFLRPGL